MAPPGVTAGTLAVQLKVHKGCVAEGTAQCSYESTCRTLNVGSRWREV
jgi:hypothetical protein